MAAKKEKLIIYQAMVRLFGNTNLTRQFDGDIQQNGCGKMSDFNGSALRSIRQLGCNYIWYTGLLQQASATDYSQYGIPTHNPQVLKGKAGSPYAISDYYSVSCDLADDPAQRMSEFDDLVNRTHEVGLRLLIDFVPNHVARHYESVSKPEGVEDLGASDNTGLQFDPQNNFYYCHEPLHLDNVNPNPNLNPNVNPNLNYREDPAKVSGNDVFNAWPSRNDWYETVKLNYGVDYCGGGRNCFDPIPNTWQKMVDILKFWCSKGVDGFRCDMVFMVPVDFWHWAIPQVKAKYPKVIFIGEIYDPAIYHSYIQYGGFDYLYDKVGLYDTLRGIVECRESASAITRCWQSLEGIQDHMLNFLENHDEQRIASDFFAGDPKKAYPALAVSLLMNTNPFMLYFGQEFGERGMDQEGFSGRDGRTTIFDYWALESMQRWIGKDHGYRKARIRKAESDVREYYLTMLNLAQTNLFSRGQFYDLTYCNHDNPGFNIHRNFAFLRNHGREVALVIANFDADEKQIAVNIPMSAWEYVGIYENRKRHFQNMITGEWWFEEHDLSVPVTAKVPGYGAVVIRLQSK